MKNVMYEAVQEIIEKTPMSPEMKAELQSAAVNADRTAERLRCVAVALAKKMRAIVAQLDEFGARAAVGLEEDDDINLLQLKLYDEVQLVNTLVRVLVYFFPTAEKPR